jgi:hypothetical protein
MLASEPRIRILLPDWIAKSCRLNIQSTRKVAKEAGISQQYVAHAAIVLQYASDQVDAVISGEIALNGESAASERWLR